MMETREEALNYRKSELMYWASGWLAAKKPSVREFTLEKKLPTGEIFARCETATKRDVLVLVPVPHWIKNA